VPKKKPKKQNPVRFRAARVDATVGSIIRRIERDYQLPEGSVRLVLPSGRKAHTDGKVNNLLTRWEV
jgi:Na+/H+-dicarboxylate symporter